MKFLEQFRKLQDEGLDSSNQAEKIIRFLEDLPGKIGRFTVYQVDHQRNCELRTKSRVVGYPPRNGLQYLRELSKLGDK